MIKSTVLRIQLTIVVLIISIIGLATMPKEWMLLYFSTMAMILSALNIFNITNVSKQFKVMMFVYSIISIGMFDSMFTGSYKISGIGFLIWTIYTFWMIHLVLFKKNNFTLNDLCNQVNKNYESSKNETKVLKKYGGMALYLTTLPMMAIGMITIGLILFCMLFIL
jgi:hypothetical protein